VQRVASLTSSIAAPVAAGLERGTVGGRWRRHRLAVDCLVEGNDGVDDGLERVRGSDSAQSAQGGGKFMDNDYRSRRA
jgi:hypothetical protein